MLRHGCLILYCPNRVTQAPINASPAARLDHESGFQLPQVNRCLLLLLSYDWLMNMSEHPTLSWEAMQDGFVFYRRHQLYSIPGKLPGDLQDFIIAGCRYGGPIGVYYDHASETAYLETASLNRRASPHAGYFKTRRYKHRGAHLLQGPNIYILPGWRRHPTIQCGYLLPFGLQAAAADFVYSGTRGR